VGRIFSHHTRTVKHCTRTRPETHAVSYETRGICLTRGILIIKIIKITTIITITIVYNGREGGDTMRRLLLLVPARTHEGKLRGGGGGPPLPLLLPHCCYHHGCSCSRHCRTRDPHLVHLLSLLPRSSSRWPPGSRCTRTRLCQACHLCWPTLVCMHPLSLAGPVVHVSLLVFPHSC
jgi:hypothetical protein